MSRKLHRVRNLWVDIRAVAAVEFAIVLPFMLLLWVGGVELGDGLAISVKVSETAHTVADLVSRNQCVTASSLSAMLGASGVTIAPYASGNAAITVSEVSTDANGKATVNLEQRAQRNPAAGKSADDFASGPRHSLARERIVDTRRGHLPIHAQPRLHDQRDHPDRRQLLPVSAGFLLRAVSVQLKYRPPKR